MLALAGCAEKPRAEEVKHVQIEARTAPNPDDVGAGVWAISSSIRNGLRVADPPPAPVPTEPVPVRGSRATADWATLLGQFGDWSIPRMMRILECESHGDENAVSPDGANWGGLEINVVNYPGDPHDLLLPATNVAIGHLVWLRQGYAAWACDR